MVYCNFDYKMKKGFQYKIKRLTVSLLSRGFKSVKYMLFIILLLVHVGTCISYFSRTYPNRYIETIW